MEYESRIDVIIDQPTYYFLKQKCIRSTALFYYADGTRFSNNKFELKTRRAKSALLHLKTKLPIVRTVAKETLTCSPVNLGLINNAIYRNILVEEGRVRVAIEQQLFQDRVEFHFIAEIEYDEHSTLSEISDCDSTIAKLTHEFGISITPERITEHLLLNAPSRLFSLFTKSPINANNIFITYKFDGYKAKIVNIAPGVVLYYDDLKKLERLKTNQFDAFPNLIFQMERLQTHFVVTDVIGYYYQKHWYMPEPLDSLRHILALSFTDTIDGLTVLVQMPINVLDIKPNPALAELKDDGWIVYSDNRIYKYKWPTMDVACFKKQLLLPDGSTLSTNDSTRLKDGHLYEIDIFNNTIIRLRNDRSLVHANTTEQIKLLRDETALFATFNGATKKCIET